MKYFNIPADFKKSTIDRYVELNQKYDDSKVWETYGQITVNNIFGSGRPVDLLPDIDFNALEEYVTYGKKQGIGFNYTLNATCLGNKEFTEDGLNQIVQFLDRIYEMGIDSLTIAIPSLIELAKNHRYPFQVKASALCEIVNANKAKAYKNLGADRMVVYESMNRSFDRLKNIREVFGDKVELIVNVICHKNCIYRPFHQNQCAHDFVRREKSVDYYTHKCMMQRTENLGNLLRLAWIRPEDMKYYTDLGIQYFKLQGRHSVYNGDPVKAVEAYMKESFDGNFMDLLDLFAPTNSFQVYLDNKKLNGFVDPFMKDPAFCKENCSSCGYCDNFVKKCIDVEKAKETFELAGKFYEEYDEYMSRIHNLDRMVVKKETELDELNFNFE